MSRALDAADVDSEVWDLEGETGVNMVRIGFSQDEEVKAMDLLRQSFRESLQYCQEAATLYASETGRHLLAEDRARRHQKDY